MERLTQWFGSSRLGREAGVAAHLQEKYTEEELLELFATKLAAYEDTGLEPQDLAEKLNDTYDLGYQSCLNHRGMNWTEAEELQRYRETGLTPEQVKSLRAQGKWEPQGMHPNGVVGNWCCSVCDGTSLEDSDYCPNCGAEMRGE